MSNTTYLNRPIIRESLRRRSGPEPRRKCPIIHHQYHHHHLPECVTTTDASTKKPMPEKPPSPRGPKLKPHNLRSTDPTGPNSEIRINELLRAFRNCNARFSMEPVIVPSHHMKAIQARAHLLRYIGSLCHSVSHLIPLITQTYFARQLQKNKRAPEKRGEGSKPPLDLTNFVRPIPSKP